MVSFLLITEAVKINKYNSNKVVVNGIKFDSKVESEYYKHLLDLQKKGIVKSFTLQPEFILLSGFTDKYGKKHLPIKYKSDFLVNYVDGTTKVIDIKGMILPEFKLKQKLYCSMYPHELVLLSYSKIDGGWIRVEDLKVARKERKKAKELAKGTSK
jgi:Protein of unknown function (DUF1064).